MRLAIDSNVLTDFLHAVHNDFNGTTDGDTKEEIIAIFRIYTYKKYIFWLLPTAIIEYMKIKDKKIAGRKSEHEHKDLHDTLCNEWKMPINRRREIEKGRDFYLTLHNKVNDCRLLAEADVAGMDVLLTRDKYFLKHLKGKERKTKLMRPSEYWLLLNIPRGSKPGLVPLNSPLSLNNIWHW